MFTGEFQDPAHFPEFKIHETALDYTISNKCLMFNYCKKTMRPVQQGSRGDNIK